MITAGMGLRFRRSLNIFPWLKLNVSRSGPSVSVGTHGAWETVSDRGARTTVGLPGTGLSYTTSSKASGLLGNKHLWLMIGVCLVGYVVLRGALS